MIKSVMVKEMKEVETKVGQECKCDICNKVIYRYKRSNTPPAYKPTKYIHYWSAMTGHHDWGNDSIDSVEHYELCSKECCRELMNKYLDEYDDSLTAYYLEIRKDSIVIEGNKILEEGLV